MTNPKFYNSKINVSLAVKSALLVIYSPDKQLFKCLFFSKEQLEFLVIWSKILELVLNQNKDRETRTGCLTT